MDETGVSVKDRAHSENQYALRKYLELFNSNCDFFKYFIAQNGVLEWFGRTIKGNPKVHDFLRYEVCPQYDHLLFETAQLCEPFESKPAHMETKHNQTEKDKTLNKSLPDSSFAGDNAIHDAQTPPTTATFDKEMKITDRQRGSITPPSAAKRFKYDDEQDLNRSFPPLLNIDDYFDRKDNSMKVTPPTIKFSYTPSMQASTSSSTGYSELRYFETTGILRSCTQPEHRSFRNSNTLNSNGTWDRETRIKVSYRIRLHDNDIQFALIIYQNVHHYSSVSKRNLIMEFDGVATPGRAVAVNQSSSPRSIPTPQQMKRKIGRRLRLL